jgi:hypothetical protein
VCEGVKGGVLTRLVWDEGVEGWVSVMCERGKEEVGGLWRKGWKGWKGGMAVERTGW